MDDLFDFELIRPEVGLRAIWKLYKWAKWGWLEDIGLMRVDIEEAFRQFDEDHVIIRSRLTEVQAQELSRIPGVKEAGKYLRLQYQLKYLDEHKEAEEGNRNEYIPRTSAYGTLREQFAAERQNRRTTK